MQRRELRYRAVLSPAPSPTSLRASRCFDEKGNVQPDRKSFIARMVTNALFHYNAQQTWSVDAEGRVRNVLA